MIRSLVAIRGNSERLPGPLVTFEPESHRREPDARLHRVVNVIRHVPLVPPVFRRHARHRKFVFFRRSVIPRHRLLDPARRSRGAPHGEIGGGLFRVGHVQSQLRLADLSLGREARRVELEHAHNALFALRCVRLPRVELDGAVVIHLITVARPALEGRVIRGFEIRDARDGTRNDADVRGRGRLTPGVGGHGVNRVPSLRRRRPRHLKHSPGGCRSVNAHGCRRGGG
mmetsp:Transcript_7540/g.31114  ORF Transcript_7540/g.31114 Transcript_7540/m.31114 type:complete len:228 (+) Transcript_7540:186-869(+)